MFTFRKRSNKKQDDQPQIHTSPSLPQLHSQGILPWPENLVDVASIRASTAVEEEAAAAAAAQQSGAAKTSFQGPDERPIPFHKPFRGLLGKPVNGGSISSLYMSNPPPSAYDNALNRKSAATMLTSSGRQSQRRTRNPPTFNLMVVGGLGTGKTSLLRLLLETADLSPTATIDQQAAVDRFLHGPTKHTQSIQTACVEICESRFDRLLFSVIDTPGLEFADGRELKLERQLNGIIKYVDAQFADTMSEESKVVRKSKGDQHIHLCIYMVDPASIMTATARRAQSSLPTKTRSETTISYRPPDLVPDNNSDESDDESSAPLTMSPAEIRVIRKISARSNVLPVIARADSLTDEKLTAVKNAVRQALREADLDFGVFGPTKKAAELVKKRHHHADSSVTTVSASGHGDGHGKINGGDDTANTSAVVEEETEDDEDDGEEDEEGSMDGERRSRPVIKLRSSRHNRALSRSRSRRDLSEAAQDDCRPISPDSNDESIANVRFSAQIVAKTDLSSLLPFALIAPEDNKRRKHGTSSNDGHFPRTPVATVSENGHGSVAGDSVQSPISTHSSRPAYLQAPPADLKGVFTRNFRWGNVDVLNPEHCDFAALRTAVLSTHLKMLKTHTKEVLYEKYRTEKLLARRATRQITEEERKKFLEELGL